MANTTQVTVTQDGPRNCSIRVEGVLDTSDLAYGILINPANLSDVGPFAGNKASALRIDRLDYSITGSTTIRLYWDATTPQRIYDCNGQGYVERATRFGDWNNTKSAGWTGAIGWDTTTNGTISGTNKVNFTIVLTLVKQ